MSHPHTCKGIHRVSLNTVPLVKTTTETKLAAQAYEWLRAAILEGRLPPGAPVSRRKLAEELGMSAVPVGDAIGRLEGEGLVESRPRAGTRVRLATTEDIRDNYVLREALETHSARLFAEWATPVHRSSLLRAAEKLDKAYNVLARQKKVSPEASARVERSHMEFHMLIANATGVRALTSAIERSRVLLFNWLFSRSAAFEPFPERWHRDLADTLVKGSPDEASQAMRVHVRFRLADVLERYQSLPVNTRMSRGPQRTPGTSPQIESNAVTEQKA